MSSAQPEDRYRGHGELILVVDDEPAIRFIASTILQRYGYRVLSAANGAEGIATYVHHRHEVALVITDMIMPLMDGPTMVATLVQIDPEVRVIVASGSITESDRERFMEFRVRHFLDKPYTARALVSALHAALSEAHHPAPH